MTDRVCIFGEVLFDHFPDGDQVLGGAPFNVAWHLQAFGLLPWLISRVGPDLEGEAVLRAMQGWKMETSGMQQDPRLPTGCVKVQIRDGEPEYEIVHPSAWDAIEAPDSPGPLVLLYHGSLALRGPDSRSSLEQLRERGAGTIFLDVNLRPPWWRRRDVLEWVRAADWVKLNQNELELLANVNDKDKTDQAARILLDDFNLRGLVLTRGAGGARLYPRAGQVLDVLPQSVIEVVDTVGAGDAFSSVMILGLSLGWTHDVCLKRAQSFASALSGRRGATVADPGFYRSFIEQWSLNVHLH